jgi:hypothetical protein
MANDDHRVYGFDTDAELRARLRDREVRFDEPGLRAFVTQALESNNLEIVDEVTPAKYHVVCVPTPFDEANKAADLEYVRSAASLLPGSLGSSDDGIGAAPGATSDLSIAGATHYTLSARGQPTGELAVGGETYLKDFDDPPGGVDFRTIGFDGWADWRHDTWAAWAGLVMSWTWAPGTPLTPSEIQSEERLEIHDRRLVTGGFRAPLPSDVRISMEITTSTGLPFTPFPATTTAGGGSGSTPDGATGSDIPTVDVPRIIRTPRSSYLRVDAEIYRSWSARVLDTPVRITPYVRVLNALDRNDALFYRYVRDEDLVEQRSLGVVPLLPVVGLEWSLL